MSIIGQNLGREENVLCVLGKPCARPKCAALGRRKLQSLSVILPRFCKVNRYFCKEESLVSVGSDTIFLNLLGSANQISRQDILKEGRHTQDQIKNSLHSLTYSYIDLDIKQFSLDRKKITILNSLTATYALLKPDKGNGIVLMKRSDYMSC